jgi:PTS system ascorbate-specific IIA component
MVDSLHENGPYIVVAPGFAFAHARPSESVRRTGMSWVRLAEPVEFGHTSNNPVSLGPGTAPAPSDTTRPAPSASDAAPAAAGTYARLAPPRGPPAPPPPAA